MTSTRKLHVIMYHYVRNLEHSRWPRLKGLHRDDFRNQIRLLEASYEMAGIESTLAFLRGNYQPSRDLCLLTFDDGLKEHFDEVVPVLGDHRISGLFFVITGCMDGERVAPVHMNHLLMATLDFEDYRHKFSRELPDGDPPMTTAVEAKIAQATYPWDIPDVAAFKYFFNFVIDPATRDSVVKELFAREIGPEPQVAEDLYLNWPKARTIQHEGMVIGGHTHRHLPLATLSPEDLRLEVETCRKALDSNLQPQAIWPFSYPYGKQSSFTDLAVAELRRLGFDCAFTTETGPNQPADDLFTIHRMDCKHVPHLDLVCEATGVHSSKRRKVCVVLVDRANYGRLKPVMQSIAAHPALELQCIAAGTMVLERFGRAVDLVRRDGFPINGEIYTELEGSTPSSMAKSVGFAVVEFSSEFQRLRPDLVLLIGDRYEAFAAATAAAYMNFCIIHVQGGEVSGSIDESARHAISKLAHYHFPSTQRSCEYLIRMGETPASILGIGCPSSDIARQLKAAADCLDSAVINSAGSGVMIDLTKPFLLAIYHPITTAYGGEFEQMRHVLTALDRIGMQTILLWPNIDAGSDRISKAVRVFRDQYRPDWLRTLTNLSPEHYLRVLAITACAVGNSSSFVRDAGYFGTPVVLVGERQEGRETDVSVIPAPPQADRIVKAVRLQLGHGRYAPSTLYGDGYVADRIAEALARLKPYIQKSLEYIHEKPDELTVLDNADFGSSNGTGRIERHPAQKHYTGVR